VETVPCISLRGVRQNNLKGFDLDLPLGQWIVITGLSGSGKSSLAFDTLYAEGQRRYIETFSPYARQFFDRMDKPAVDRIENIPPAIAIEQCNSVRSTRSTVGTMTEICDHMKVVWPHLARPHCLQCGQAVQAEPPDRVWETVLQRIQMGEGSIDALVTFELPLSEKMGLTEQFQLMTQQGFQRLLIEGRVVRLEEAQSLLKPGAGTVQIIADRLRLETGQRCRFGISMGRLRFHRRHSLSNSIVRVAIGTCLRPSRLCFPSTIRWEPARHARDSGASFPSIPHWRFRTRPSRSKAGWSSRGKPEWVRNANRT